MTTNQNIQLEIINPSPVLYFRTMNARGLWGFWYRHEGTVEIAVRAIDFNQTFIPPQGSAMVINRAEQDRGTGVNGQIEVWTLTGQKVGLIRWRNPWTWGEQNSVEFEPEPGVFFLIDIGDYPRTGLLGHVQATIQILDE